MKWRNEIVTNPKMVLKMGFYFGSIEVGMKSIEIDVF